MTNHEATDVLKVLKAVWEEKHGEGEAEALRMAIEALEKQTPSRPHKLKPHYISIETYYCKCGERINLVVDWTAKMLKRDEGAV